MISDAQVDQYISSQSSFAFELRVLRRVRELGFEAEHGGTYFDPITKKLRHYDIRARRVRGSSVQLFAIECTCIAPDTPFVALSVPRAEEECFLDVMFSYTEHVDLLPALQSARRFDLLRIWADSVGQSAHPIYRVGAPVSKELSRVKVNAKAELEPLLDSDKAFTKCAQAVSAASGLIKEARFPDRMSEEDSRVWQTSIVPVLVVPDDCAWSADFELDGSVAPAKKVSRISHWIDHKWPVTDKLNWILSHVEIVCFSGLADFLLAECDWEAIFTTKEADDFYSSEEACLMEIGTGSSGRKRTN